MWGDGLLLKSIQSRFCDMSDHTVLLGCNLGIAFGPQQFCMSCGIHMDDCSAEHHIITRRLFTSLSAVLMLWLIGVNPAKCLKPSTFSITSQIKLPIPDMLPSESLLRTDSLSSIEPAFSDGSVGSAPSLGPSPGPSNIVDISRNDLSQTHIKLLKHQEKAAEVKSTRKNHLAQLIKSLYFYPDISVLGLVVISFG